MKFSRTATMTSKGQVTIPKAVREHLKLEEGSLCEFTIVKGEENVILKKQKPILSTNSVDHILIEKIIYAPETSVKNIDKNLLIDIFKDFLNQNKIDSFFVENCISTLNEVINKNPDFTLAQILTLILELDLKEENSLKMIATELLKDTKLLGKIEFIISNN